MHILVLGGIGEAVQLAGRLALVHSVTYSVAGRGRVPELACPVRVGGFGGVKGLADFLAKGCFDLLIDATHPYAAQISRHASLAARQLGMPLWVYRRPPWQPQPGDDWRAVRDWPAMQRALEGFHRPLFTIGIEPLKHLENIPPHQHWLVRCLAAQVPARPGLAVMHALGPFNLRDEMNLLRTQAVDVLVSKNSGGSAVAAKLAAARQLAVPVIMLERPPLPVAERAFSDIESLLAALATL